LEESKTLRKTETARACQRSRKCLFKNRVFWDRLYLKVTLTATNSVVVSWPMADGSGWVLQAANTLSAPSVPWHTIPPPYQTNGEHLQYIEPVPYGTKFYRLSTP